MIDEGLGGGRNSITPIKAVVGDGVQVMDCFNGACDIQVVCKQNRCLCLGKSWGRIAGSSCLVGEGPWIDGGWPDSGVGRDNDRGSKHKEGRGSSSSFSSVIGVGFYLIFHLFCFSWPF